MGAVVEVLADFTPRLNAAAREVADTRDAYDAARERRDELVVRAVDEGMSHRQVATAAGISPARVVAILAVSQPDAMTAALPRSA